MEFFQKEGAFMAREFMEVRRKNQVTLPKALTARLQIKEGDVLEYSVEDGKIIITPKVLISKEQAWFWSKEWQQGEREVQEELKEKGAGKVHTAKSLLQEISDV